MCVCIDRLSKRCNELFCQQTPLCCVNAFVNTKFLCTLISCHLISSRLISSHFLPPFLPPSFSCTVSFPFISFHFISIHSLSCLPFAPPYRLAFYDVKIRNALHRSCQAALSAKACSKKDPQIIFPKRLLLSFS